jgi:hypothetical protein
MVMHCADIENKKIKKSKQHWTRGTAWYTRCPDVNNLGQVLETQLIKPPVE